MDWLEDKCEESGIFAWIVALIGIGLMVWIYLA
jgi:hypothetical protein